MGFGKSVATPRLAAQHGVFAPRIFARAKRAQGQSQICNQAENSVLCVLDPVLPAMQSSSAGSAPVNSPLNDADHMTALVTESETSREVWGPAALEQRREQTRDHLAKIAARRETWIHCNKY